MSLPLAMALSGLDEEQFGSDLKYLYDHGARLIQPLNSTDGYKCDKTTYYIMPFNGGDPYIPRDEDLQQVLPRLAYWDFLSRIDEVMLQRLNPKALLATVSAWPSLEVSFADMSSTDTSWAEKPWTDTPWVVMPSRDIPWTSMPATDMTPTDMPWTAMPAIAMTSTAMPSTAMTSTDLALTTTFVTSTPLTSTTTFVTTAPSTSTFVTSAPSISKTANSLPPRQQQSTPTSEPVIKYGNRDILDLGNNIRGANTWGFQPARLHEMNVVPRRLIPENRSQYFRTQNKYLRPTEVETCPVDDCKFNTVHYC